MKALFIGGTGAISSAITELVSRTPGWDLYLLNRGTRNGDLPKNVHTIICDINDEEKVMEATAGLEFDRWCDAVIEAQEKAKSSLLVLK